MNMFTFLAPVYNALLSGLQKRQSRELLNRLATLTDKKVLDLGGGTGRLAEQMLAVGADVWLLDSSPQMLEQARKVLPPERVIHGDATTLPFNESTFDVITVVDAFHHIREQENTLKACLRILRPAGSIYLVEFDPCALSIRILAALERILGEPALFLAPQELEKQLLSAGFTDVSTEYILADEYITHAVKPMALE